MAGGIRCSIPFDHTDRLIRMPLSPSVTMAWTSTSDRMCGTGLGERFAILFERKQPRPDL